MTDSQKVSLVIPVYNEQENLEKLYEELKNVLQNNFYWYEIIFIDDGSKDGSLEVLKNIYQHDNGPGKLKIISLRRNFGQTAALSAGFSQAKGEVIITLDADLQNDPQDIPLLLSYINQGYDIVSGWRKQRKDSFLSRKIPSYLANKLISKITGVNLHDYGCSLKAYRSEVIKNINLYGEMHRFLPALASEIGVKIIEIPVNHRERFCGKSKYNLSRTTRVILDLINVKFLLSYKTRPIQIFGSIGLLSIVLGLVSGFAVIYLKFFKDFDVTGNPLFLLTILFILIGTQFIVLGLLGEIIIRVYHESQGKPIYLIKEVLERNE